jgi:hypothetical protein
MRRRRIRAWLEGSDPVVQVHGQRPFPPEWPALPQELELYLRSEGIEYAALEEARGTRGEPCSAALDLHATADEEPVSRCARLLSWLLRRRASAM